MVVAVGVDGEDPDEGVTVVDMDEAFDFDDTAPAAGETDPDLDEFAAESDVAGGTNLADKGMLWIGRFGHLVGCGELDHVRVGGFGVVAFGWGGVSDALMGSSAVVVMPEAVEEFLEMIEVEDGAFVLEPFFEGSVEPFELSEGLGVIRR